MDEPLMLRRVPCWRVAGSTYAVGGFGLGLDKPWALCGPDMQLYPEDWRHPFVLVYLSLSSFTAGGSSMGAPT